MTNLIKRIGTHNGVFHCDEVLACFMLKKLPEYTNAEIVRTRDEEILDTCDVVVDVGGVYDPLRHRYDHHQRSFEHTMKTLIPSKPWNVKLSSAGLVYHHFGEKILQAILGPPHDRDVLGKLYDYVYENFILEIDGIDNGVPMFEGEPRYRINTGLSSRVKKLNPAWNGETVEDPQKLFYSAMELVGKEFLDTIHSFTNTWWPARELVREAILNRSKVHESGEIIELEKFCPWLEHLFILEEELDIKGLIKFTVFNDNNWRVQGVPLAPKSFLGRVFLNESWRGLRGDELSKKCGISDCVFVHTTGFIGGNKTREGAIEMAVKSLQLHKAKNKE